MKKMFFIMAATLAAIFAQAAAVDEELATRTAAAFMQAIVGREVAVAKIACGYEGLYLFTIGDGFVVVAADDVARPVLAYSTEGGLEEGRVPKGMSKLLAVFDAEIVAAREAGLPRHKGWDEIDGGRMGAPTAKDTPNTVGPLLTTKWGQRAPYNGMCPSGVPSGCVATAMSQVMRFWSYPAFGYGDHSYVCSTYGNQYADFAHTRYDWDNMPDVVRVSSAAAERNAVAVLTYHVGVSVNMGYNAMQSGATTGTVQEGQFSAQNALGMFFHYNRADLEYTTKGQTSNDDWTAYVKSELVKGWPIMYDGSGPAGGHSFVCDGYDSLGYLHFNLGEDGEGDGYYAVGAIDYGPYSLNQTNAVITGIHPEYGIYAADTVMVFDRTGGEKELWVYAADTAGRPWTVESDADWLSYADADFAVLGAMRLVAEANGTGAERTAMLTLRQGEFSTTLEVKQAAYDEADYCQLSVTMTNDRNQAWNNGAALQFVSPGGLVYATVAHEVNGGQSTATVMVAPHDVVVHWVEGGPLDRSYGYTVKNQHGDVLVSVSNAYYDAEDVLLPWPCAPLEIDKVEDEVVRVYPNPTEGHFEIVATAAVRSVSVLNSVGQRVDAVCAIDGCRCVVDMREAVAGIYVVLLTTDEGNSVHRVCMKR